MVVPTALVVEVNSRQTIRGWTMNVWTLVFIVIIWCVLMGCSEE